jgi:BirA family biotin operon repressor/biotin-[acetyl-CoA-carboxylase] ligase
MPAAGGHAAWLIELPSCPSTNTWALEHVDALAHGSCVWTQKQTKGRGRGGNAWKSPAGVLTASFVIDIARGLNAQQLSLAAGLAIAHAVEDLAPKAEVRIKWPNDCYVKDRKLAGILCESAASKGRHVMVIGIGLNVAPEWEESEPLGKSAIALADIVGKPPAMKMLLAGLRRYLLEADGLITANGWRRLLDQLRERDWLVGKPVRIASDKKSAEGIAVGFDEQGRLMLEHNGKVAVYSSGTLSLRGLGGPPAPRNKSKVLEFRGE